MPFFSRSKSGSASPPTNKNALGLKVLYAPALPICDIVFVHGLTGHRENTWAVEKNKASWLETLLPGEVPEARLLTFGYDAKVADWRSVVSQNRIGDHSRKLLHDLANLRGRDDAALLTSRNAASSEGHLQKLVQVTKGIMFLGTPHSGSGLAQWAVWFATAIKPLKKTSTAILEVLKRNSEVLARIQTDFHTMIRDMSQNGHPIKLMCFYEEIPVQGIGFVVAKDSAILSAYPHVGVHANHMGITKFSDERDPGFVAISSELRRWNLQMGTVDFPYERHATFVGREEIILKMKIILQENSCIILAGIGGIGKSEIAIEYCYQYMEHNPKASVFWIPMDTISKFEQAYTKIAQKLNLTGWNKPGVDLLPFVKNYLMEQHAEPWLLVIDNADDIDMLVDPEATARHVPLESFIPFSPRCQIIVTTRHSHVGQVIAKGRAAIEEIPGLTTEEAEKLFYSALPFNLEPDRGSLLKILQILDNLPLAITQATSYIKWNNISVAQYLAELQESETGLQALLSFDQIDMRRGLDRMNSVVRSWKLSFDTIQKKCARAGDLLCVMALCNRQNIPRDLLRRQGESHHELTVALGLLQSFSLINMERNIQHDGVPEVITYSMHRLVQVVTCAWKDMQGTKEQSQQEALSLMLVKFPNAVHEGDQTDSQRRLCLLLLPHAERILCYKASDHGNQLLRATLQYNVSSYEFSVGHYQSAERRCSEAYNLRHQFLGMESLETLRTGDLLGQILSKGGKYKISRGIQETIMKHKKAILGAEHLDTIFTITNLTSLYVLQGEFAEAERFAKHALEVRRPVLGEAHLKTICSIKTLAYVNQMWGKFKIAEEFARKAFQAATSLLGCYHQTTIECASMLAYNLSQCGKITEAAPLAKDVLQKRRDLLGKKHPDTLVAMNELASLERLLGNFSAAEFLYRAALLEFESSLGPDNPESLVCTSNLSVVLREVGKLEEAELMGRQALVRREKVFGRDNPRTLVTVHGLARILDDMGKYDEAEVLAIRALGMKKRVLGERAASTLKSMSILARILIHKGDMASARDLLLNTIELREATQDASHPELVQDRLDLAIMETQESDIEKD